MTITILGTALIIAGASLLILGTLPMQNTVEEKDLVVKFVIGKKVIDISDAVVKPIPEDVKTHFRATANHPTGTGQSVPFEALFHTPCA